MAVNVHLDLDASFIAATLCKVLASIGEGGGGRGGPKCLSRVCTKPAH